MRVLSVVHQRDAGPGVFAAAGAELVEWMPSAAPPPALEGFDAMMVFGGAMNVDQEARHPWLTAEKRVINGALEAGLPILGVCLGSQLLGEAAGAEVRRAREPEIGWLEIALEPASADDPLLESLPGRLTCFQWHSYEALLPPGATALARSPVCLQAFRLDDAPAWGIQFHAEVTEAGIDAWLADYRSDPDAVRIGLEPELLRVQSQQRIGAWNEIGRGIAARFLAVASRLTTRE